MDPLPKEFPAEQLSRTALSKVLWFYERYVEDYYSSYGFGHFIMAAYASVPSLLTPDLLYKLWQNFNQYEWRGEMTSIHRVAVSDILLSPLCREMGYELFEIVPEIRNAFLEWLEASARDPNWKNRHLHESKTIAEFVMEYHDKPNPGGMRWGQDYEDIQHWNALNYTQPETAQQQLWNKLKDLQSENKETASLRIMDLMAKSDKQVDILFRRNDRNQLKSLKNNSVFANAWKALIQHNSNAFVKIMEDHPELKVYLKDKPVAGSIEVRLSENVLKNVDEVRPPIITAIAIGINKYKNDDIPQLNGCVQDIQSFTEFLESYSKQNNRKVELLPFYDEQATIRSVQSALSTFSNARNGDIILFYFSGHSRYQNLEDGKGRRLMLYDSDPFKHTHELSHFEIEELLYPILREKSVHAVLIFDTHDAVEKEKSELYSNQIRSNPQALQGSLVILNSGRPGDIIIEARSGSKNVGLFSYYLKRILEEGAAYQSYGHIAKKINIRLDQTNYDQTVVLNTFPAIAEDYVFLTQTKDPNVTYKVVFDKRSGWMLLAGRIHGITPSLDFMMTSLQLTDGRIINVGEVFNDRSTIMNFTGDGDTSEVYEAKLLQTALPKVKVAIDNSVDKEMVQNFERSIEDYNIYYIDLVHKIDEARFLIKSKDKAYYLVPSFQKITDRPVFKYEADPFEFIKQIEYIAQWHGILEYQNPEAPVYTKDVRLHFEKLEGTIKPPSTEELEKLKGQSVEDFDPLELVYKNNMAPAFRCKIQSLAGGKEFYVNVLFLDLEFAIHYLGTYHFPVYDTVDTNDELKNTTDLQLNVNGRIMKTFEIELDEKYLELGVYDKTGYLKFFVSDQPLDVTALLQETLTLDKSETTRGIWESDDSKTSFDISEVEWSAISVPVRIVRPTEKVDEVSDIATEGKLERELLFNQGHALIIGPGSEHENINFSRDRNAQLVYHVLTDPQRAAYPPDQARLLINESANRKNVINAFEELADNLRHESLNKNDNDTTVFIYLTSKYTLDPNLSDKDLMILLSDSVEGQVVQDGLEIALLSRFLSNILKYSRRLILVLDIAYAAETLKRIKLPDIEKNITSQGDYYFIGASTGRILSPDSGNSLLAKCLVDALTFNEENSEEEYVQFTEIWDYLKEEVPNEARNLGSKQNPFTLFSGDTDFAIAKRSNLQKEAIDDQSSKETLISETIFSLEMPLSNLLYSLYLHKREQEKTTADTDPFIDDEDQQLQKFTDPRDNQEYPVIEINGQVWMGQNLNFDTDEGSWHYNDDPEIGKSYGRLYTWDAAREACPPGWRLPSKEELQFLTESFENPDELYKALSISGEDGRNNSLGGSRYTNREYHGKDELGFFWTNTPYDEVRSWYAGLNSDINKVQLSFSNNDDGFSCRCIREIEVA